MSHLAAAPLNRASFTPTSFNASIPQYVILPNYKDPDTSMRYDMQFEVNPPQACLVSSPCCRIDITKSVQSEAEKRKDLYTVKSRFNEWPQSAHSDSLN